MKAPSWSNSPTIFNGSSQVFLLKFRQFYYFSIKMSYIGDLMFTSMRPLVFPYSMNNHVVFRSLNQYIKTCFSSNFALSRTISWDYEFLTVIWLKLDTCSNNLYYFNFLIVWLPKATWRAKRQKVSSSVLSFLAI